MTALAPQRHGVLAVVRNSNGGVLMQLRDDRADITWPAHWTVLGGGVEPGEDVRDALLREVHEECGLLLEDVCEVGQVIDKHGSGQLLHVFVAETEAHPDALVLGEGQALAFVGPERWPDLLIPPFVRALLIALSEGSRI